MQNCFRLKGDTLYVLHEPVNGAREFSELCLKLINSEHREVFIDVHEDISNLSSVYLGCIINCGVLAHSLKKRLLMKCSDSLKVWLQIIGGDSIVEFVTKG